MPLREKMCSFLWARKGQDFKLGLLIWLYHLGTPVNLIFILHPICMLQLHDFRSTRQSAPAPNAHSQRPPNNSPNQYLNSLNMIWNKKMQCCCFIHNGSSKVKKKTQTNQTYTHMRLPNQVSLTKFNYPSYKGRLLKLASTLSWKLAWPSATSLKKIQLWLLLFQGISSS